MTIVFSRQLSVQPLGVSARVRSGGRSGARARTAGNDCLAPARECPPNRTRSGSGVPGSLRSSARGLGGTRLRGRFDTSLLVHVCKSSLGFRSRSATAGLLRPPQALSFPGFAILFCECFTFARPASDPPVRSRTPSRTVVTVPWKAWHGRGARTLALCREGATLSSNLIRCKRRSQPGSRQKKLLIGKQRHLVGDEDNASKQMFFLTDLI
ncbi:PREDICTED: uncharacterized protein LOC101379793 [Odobenus rosmarus divergens]|uniref:Uncharacterized protein LOC101379793 n=1 Tax=Odobenus rosmarus divergens TaxID=9708 RepID=A0A9B0GDX4_ODORO